ncbi:MAG: AAA family ATPase [Clostridia bacterium]|nr:AAA family ATPase [Clostridia bacterium]
MILLSCYIENYGALSEKSIEFQRDLTVFCEENGYGKTTLVSFLKAMLYGLPSYKATSKGFPERQHFYPFNGGKFGGNLTFEHEGKSFRVERFFDKKSETKDECRIFCDTLETEEFGKNGELLGRTLLKLDEDSFVRTLFAEDLSSEFSMTTDLGVALNRLVDDTDDDRNFEQAIKRLTERRKELHTDRGNRGLIPEKKAEIRALDEQIGRFKNIHQKELEQRYAEKREAHRASEVAHALLNQAMQQSYWDIYDEKITQLEKKREELAALHAEYPKGIPTAEERERLAELLRELKDCLMLVKASEDEKKRKRLAELALFFEKKTPSDAELSEFDLKNADLEHLEVEIETLRQGAESDRLALSDSPFHKKMPSDAELAVLQQRAKLYRENQTLLHSFHERITPQKTVSKKAAISSSVGAAVLLFGFAFLFLLWPIGLGALLVGGGALAFGLYEYFACKKKEQKDGRARAGELLSLQKKNASLRQVLLQMLSAYNYPQENDPNLTYERFCHDLEGYRLSLKKLQKAEERIEEKRRLAEIARQELQAFLADYPLEMSMNERQALRFLLDALGEYQRLSAETDLSLQQKEKAEARVTELFEAVKEFGLTYGISFEPKTLNADILSTLAQLSAQESALKKSISSLKEEAEKHKNTYGLDKHSDVRLKESLQFYREASKEAQMRESELESRIREIEFELEELPELENRRARAVETLAQYELSYRTVTQTVQLLQKAEQNLMDRYVMPVRDSFCAYASALESTLGEKIRMDKEFCISFERGGELRSDKHLSAGQYAISALCMRLALSEQIYGENLPFLILDDPFVHLDEKHLQKALRTVAALSKKTQILYFTCHASRAQFEK